MEFFGDGRTICPVILSGGAGKRLWPLSTEARPKQFLALLSEQSLLQMTAMRTAEQARFSAPIIVGNALHLEEIQSQLDGIGVRPRSIILEPFPRNTAPAITLAALAAEDNDLLLVMPSDHSIADVAAFHAAINSAVPAAEEGWLVTFGITPDRPETGYGYIEVGEELFDGTFRVAAFLEKPDESLAQRLFDGGGHLWNGGMFLFRARALLDAVELAAPELFENVSASMATGSIDGLVMRPNPASFSSAPSISIDYAVMEISPNVAVVPVQMGWSDVGSWDALAELTAPDENANRLEGNVIVRDTNGCSIRSTGPLVAAVGVQGLTIIATEDAVLIIPKGRSQDVARIVEALKARQADESTHFAGA